MEESTSLRNGNEDYSIKQLRHQIDALKKVIHDKNIQLNMVIKTAEEKYHDIHKNYRDLAIQLNDSWKHKYENLEQKNTELHDTINYIKEQNEMKKESNSNNENDSDNASPVSDIPIENIAETLDFDHTMLNQLTGGNIEIMLNAIKPMRPFNGHNNKRKLSKPKIKHQVLEQYLD